MFIDNEAELNKKVAKEFVTEYNKAAGKTTAFFKHGDKFPDVILKDISTGKEIGVEMVSVLFSWVNAEGKYYSKFKTEFYKSIQKYRPKFRQFRIMMQANAKFMEQQRPVLLPKTNSKQGKRLIAEFEQLIVKHAESLAKTHGTLLNKFINADGELEFPELTNIFDAISVQHPVDDNDKRRPHPEDPVILDGPIMYAPHGVIPQALNQAFQSKFTPSKGATDILLLHNFDDSQFVTASMAADNQAMSIAQEIIKLNPGAAKRYDEIWFFNRFFGDNPRLIRLN